MEKKKEETKLQILARQCQYGVIGSLEKFFHWYGRLIATYPKYAIVASLTITVLGGLGLLRFYEEGDAASMVIPRQSDFRKNMDWLDNNFPREFRTHSILYQADNVLTPEVIQTIYKQRTILQQVTIDDRTFQDFCIKVPVLKLPPGGVFSCRNKKEVQDAEPEIEDFTPFWEVDNDDNNTRSKREVETDQEDPFSLLYSYLWSNPGEIDINMLEEFSNTFYPGLYCDCVEATQKACYEQNILELWGDQGSYSDVTEKRIGRLTQQEIIDVINTKNTSQIFMKDFDFTDLLGNIRYNQTGHIVGAGVVEMRFFTTVNVTDVKLRGTATRGEKIDIQSYKFEGEMVKLLQNKSDFPSGVTSLTNIQRQFFDSFVGQTFKVP